MTTNPFDSQDFRKEMAELLDDRLKPITELVSEHEKYIQRSRGAFWVLNLFWLSLVGCAEYLFHRKP